MPQPAVVDELEQPLLDSYRRAWAAVQAEQEKLATDPLAFRRKIRLTEMRQSIEAIMNELDTEAGEWVAQQLPKVYAQGMVSTPGAASSVWSMVHQEAVEELGVELFKELLSATDGVRDSTKQLVRSVARDQALQKAIIGKTRVQAGKEMERILSAKGISSITYRDGSKHGLAEYTQVAMRTTTAKAYNRGTLNAHSGVTYFEIFDGPNCGLSTHSDPRLALGMVVDRSTCEQYPISHPNCRRAFGPRPDITTANQADKASPTSTADQRQAQLDADGTKPDGREDVFTKREKRLAEQRERYKKADQDAAEKKRLARMAERQAKLDEVELMRAAQEAAAAAASREIFPEFAKLPDAEDYSVALTRVNPGRGVAERRNNCHFVAPSMELRARGYDVVASPTFKDNGRFDHGIEKDWVDPATGEQRKFNSVPLAERVSISGKTAKYVDLSPADIYIKLMDRTADWPPNSRGFVVGEWKAGGGHIWNMYKDAQGNLRFVDGQVQNKNAYSHLARVKVLRIMRVDDLEPVPDRLLVSSKPAPKRGRTGQEKLDAIDALGPRPTGPDELEKWRNANFAIQEEPELDGAFEVSKDQQRQVGLDLLAQLYDDYGDSGRFAYSMQDQIYDLERKLKSNFGVKDPYAAADDLRQANRARRSGASALPGR